MRPNSTLAAVCFPWLVTAAAAAPLEVSITAVVTDVLDNGFEGNLSDHVSPGQLLSANWVIDGMATAPTVNNTTFNPTSTLEEYITTFTNIVQSASATVGGAVATGPVGALSTGHLSRIRTELYDDLQPGPGPHEVSDYAQLRAASLEVSLAGGTIISGFMTLTQEHTTQSFEGLCSDGGIGCLFEGVAGQPGAIPWQNQRVGLFVNRWGTALADLTSMNVESMAIPEPTTWLLVASGVLTLAAYRRRIARHRPGGPSLASLG